MPNTHDFTSAKPKNLGGTDLDHKLRGAYNTLEGFEAQLEKAKGVKAKTIENFDAEIARLESSVAEAKADLAKIVEEKKEKEPDTKVPGLRKKKPIPPPGKTIEEWHEMRKKGEHLEYLNG